MKIKAAYIATKLEEDTKRWEYDGEDDIDTGSCAHFCLLTFSFEFETVEFSLQKELCF